jgi:hypothetical protein
MKHCTGHFRTWVPIEKSNRDLIRDGQRIIEAIEVLVRIHKAQEEDIYDHSSGASSTRTAIVRFFVS